MTQHERQRLAHDLQAYKRAVDRVHQQVGDPEGSRGADGVTAQRVAQGADALHMALEQGAEWNLIAAHHQRSQADPDYGHVFRGLFVEVFFGLPFRGYS